MADLLGLDVRTISEHLKNVHGSREWIEQATLRNFPENSK
ncbi:MAG: hypothetical protein ACI9U2_000445 [Bradymonadia bacterium]|jgi:hypothetical protein